ncbi:MAG: uridine phosphorylase, partial [Candidatus Hermodarchaeota archaeon]|nr:uridine phosphorylase [Candidatus Hermodarchaeota archaeon]
MKKWDSALRPQTDEGIQYHIGLKGGDIASTVLLPGDPARAKLISELWDSAEHKASKRSYVTYTGVFKKTPLSTTSTGIGCPATAIAVEELASIGANTFIRVGSSGAILREIRCGDLIISTGAVRYDGTSQQYVTTKYPALAHHQVILALIEAAETLGHRYHVGVTCSTDSFFTGQGRAGYDGYWQSFMNNILPDLQAARVLNFEMECATLFTLSTLFGLRSGAVCTVFANRETNDFATLGEREASETACEAAKILA